MIKRIFSILILFCFYTIPTLLMLVSGIVSAQESQRVKARSIEIRTMRSIEKEVERELINHYIVAEKEPTTPSPKPSQIIKPIDTIAEEKEMVDRPSIDTIYSNYTDDEIWMLQQLIEAEVTSGEIEDKMNVANVIFNRMADEEFPDTVEKVIFQKIGGYYQFSPISDKRFWSVKVTEDTITAVERAFQEDDTTSGSLYFCNYKNVQHQKTKRWFDGLEYIMTDSAGHSFYK